MTDLTKLLAQIQKPETSHVDMVKRRAKGTLQWFLENDVQTHPIHNNNHLEFFMCGQEGFASIQKDILAADSSIDLVLWGFDPGMELVRSGSRWPRGQTYGDLLQAKARSGVKVRMLVWYGGNALAHLSQNVGDMGALSPATIWGMPDEVVVPGTEDLCRADRLAARHRYCSTWWDMALRNKFWNLEVRLRKAHPVMIQTNIQTYLPSSVGTAAEYAGLAAAGTHHQKPVLIDYAARGKAANTCAYVMGLNSVTDYWDTTSHRFNEPLREDSPDGASWTPSWHLKPYRDYAIRVQGEALHSINENFVQGWDQADGYGERNGVSVLNSSLEGERKSIRAKDLPAPAGASHRAQIVRTFPDRLDATILKAYTLASSNAINYIYVENQYFQLSDWSKLVKAMRAQYRTAMIAAGAKVADITPLHIMVVIPQPERDQMVPNTYDTLDQLAQAQGMSNYDKQVQGQRKPQPDSQGVIHAVVHPSDTAADGVAKDSLDAAPANPIGELNALGIRTLAAMLMTYDGASEAKDILISKRDSNEQEAQARTEAAGNAKAKVHGGLADDADDTNYSEFNIKPRPYREIYIHSKLMFVDDTFTTLGSANLNVRSMVGDSEFNICTEQPDFTQAARRRAWGNLAGADLDGGSCSLKEMTATFDGWVKRMSLNRDTRKRGAAPVNASFIHPFEDARGAPAVRLA